MKSHRGFLFCGLSILLTGVLLGHCPAAGQSLPTASLPLFDGGTLDLQSLKGNVVVIRMLASW